MGFWFWYGTKLWAEVTEPSKLVALVETMIDDNINPTREMLEKEIIKSGPTWAASLSKTMIDAAPDGRKKLESVAIDQMDDQINTAHLITEDEFRKYLRKHRTLIEAKFKELATSPELAELSLIDIVRTMEAELKTEFTSDVAEVLKTVKTFNANFKELKSGRNLGKDELLERQVWMLARRLLHDQQIDPSRLSKSSPTQPKKDQKTEKK